MAAQAAAIGLLAAGSKAAGERYYGRFQEGMREFGHVEGRDYTGADHQLYARAASARGVYGQPMAPQEGRAVCGDHTLVTRRVRDSIR